MDIANQNILITGGGRGIGYALARDLARNANKVIVLDKEKELLDQLQKETPSIVAYQANLTDLNQVHSTVANIFSEQEKVNVLVNNVGLIHSEPLINILSKEDKKHSIDNWHKTIDINLNTTFYMTSHVVEQMVTKRQKGVVINISSISAKGNAGQSAYSAAKAAINALTVTWSKELGMFGIRCNAIAPGFFDTDSTHQALDESKIKAYQKNTPVGRLGKTDEIVDAIEFIIGNDFYNGSILELDGGLVL